MIKSSASSSCTVLATVSIGALMLFSIGCAGRTDLHDIEPVPATKKPPVAGIDPPASVEVAYDHDVVVFTTARGAAAVDFHRASRHGDAVHYRYRFAPAGGGDEFRGTGKVCEKWTPVPATQPAPPHNKNAAYIVLQQYRTDGSVLFVEAGPVRFEWSQGSNSSGWVYYDPDEYCLRLARRRDFETLDLGKAAILEVPRRRQLNRAATSPTVPRTTTQAVGAAY
ncbi:MAG: hypothetical protein QOE14_1935 [Humisphaera sp.]|nr:hypothetical protein [Humisphaera sp.]